MRRESVRWTTEPGGNGRFFRVASHFYSSRLHPHNRKKYIHGHCQMYIHCHCHRCAHFHNQRFRHPCIFTLHIVPPAKNVLSWCQRREIASHISRLLEIYFYILGKIFPDVRKEKIRLIFLCSLLTLIPAASLDLSICFIPQFMVVLTIKRPNLSSFNLDSLLPASASTIAKTKRNWNHF